MYIRIYSSFFLGGGWGWGVVLFLIIQLYSTMGNVPISGEELAPRPHILPAAPLWLHMNFLFCPNKKLLFAVP